MKPIKIRYSIKISQDPPEIIDLQIDPISLELINKPTDNLPAWTKLGYQKCPHCPLDEATHPYCPVAVNLVDIVSRFNNVVSYDKVILKVITRERTYARRTTAQKAVSSLFGLLMATSGCPYTTFLKPMARFHLPLASQEETIYRVTGTYLLAQYFRSKRTNSIDKDFEGLHRMYTDLHIVNVEFAARIRQLTEGDSTVNAIVLLDVFANVLPFAIEDELERIQALFEPYFQDIEEND